jgi:uncharacterized protein (DUF1499 family)
MREVGWAPWLAIASAVCLLVGPLGTRFGLWPFTVGFLFLALSLLLGIATVIVSLFAAVRLGQWSVAALSTVVGLVVMAIPLFAVISARGAPPINDISTDLGDPPRFDAIVPLRAGAPNPPEYGGQEFATQQARAYPDLRSIALPMPASAAFERALATAREQGWTVVASDPPSGRIEATDTTFWFGFTDDIVIRVREAEAGARVDVRSKSRVGRGDLGTNARRIRTFAAALRANAS